VLGWDLGNMARSVSIHAFVRAPFDKYVHDDSTFWNASGISVKLAGTGIDVRMESLKALLMGGIAFESRPGTSAPQSQANQRFQLYADRESARAAGFSHHLKLLSNFSGSVAGLDVGADVTMHGLKIGEVTEVGLVFDPKIDRVVAPVHYRIDAERISGIAAIKGLPPGTIAAEMVRRGFRAVLQTPSLIAPGKVVALEFVPGAPPDELGRDGDVFIVPSSESGGFDSIARSANELLSKINRIDFDAIGVNVANITKGLDTKINGPEIKSILADAQDTMRKIDAGVGPALAKLPDIANQLQTALTQITRLASSINTGYGGDSRLNRDIETLVRQLTDTVRSVRALSDLLTRDPQALIKGRGKD
jgi:paraquat-inducible protein B